MSNSNKHIEEFLDYYLEHETSPDYAVLITGCWGSGKTYFIRQYLESKGATGKDVVKTFDWLTGFEKYTVIYVSLFGAKTRKDINKKIERILHPKVNSKKLKYLPDAISLVSNLAGITIGTAIAASTTVATGGSTAPYAFPAAVATGKTIGSFFKTLLNKFFNRKKDEEYFVSDFLEEIKRKRLVVVFDDVERADMPLPELLGYLNEYIEHLHVPCILLADKDKWEEAQKCQKDKSTLHHLSSTKEKIIGKEFQIQTSFDDVWNFWSISGNHPIGDRAWNVVKNFRLNIQLVLEVIGANNYRALKHSLSDFQHFIEKIEDEFLSNEEFNRLLIADFFSHQYAYYTGWFVAADIGQSNAMERAFAKGTHDNEKNEAEILKKYPILPYEKFEKTFRKIDSLSNIYTIENYSKKWTDVWKDWFSLNYIEPGRLNNLIKESIWFDLKNDYYFNKMYEWFMLDDETGQKTMRAFEKALQDKKFTSPISIMCLCCKLYWYAKHGVFVEDYNAFCQKMEDYVVFAKDKLLYENVDDWKHHTMLDSAYDEIKNELDRLQEVFKDVLSEKTVSHKQKQMEEFLSNLGNTKSAISEHTSDTIAHEYLNGEPFDFGMLDAKKFCDAYQSIPRHVKRNCFVALGSRYKYHPEQLEKERFFLENLLKRSQEIYDNAKRPLTPSIFAFYYLIRTIKEILGEKDNVA